MANERVKINSSGFSPHAGQLEMLRATHKYRVTTVVVGRRWGKTLGSQLVLLDHAPLAKDRKYRAAYCAPTFRLAKEVYDSMKESLGPLVEKASDTDLTLRLRPMGMEWDGGWTENKGGVIHFWSMELHDNLRGFGLDFVVMDECSDIMEQAYTQTLTPMTAGTRGKFLLIGTPRRVGVGFVWFRTEWNFGMDQDHHPDHYSMQGPTEQNPYMPVDFLRNLRESSHDPKAVAEEYDAAWVEDEGAVFERLGDCFVLPALPVGTSEWVLAGPDGKAAPVVDTQHLMSVDFGRHGDPTVIGVWRRDTRDQVCLVRMFNEEYETQLERIHLLRAKYRNALICADGNGMGAPLVERLARKYRDGVKDTKWSSNSVKEEDITKGRLLFQRAEWRFLNVKWQQAEFQNYTREKLPMSGRWRYTAPPNGHDDAVAAACMASEILSLPWIAPRKPSGPPAAFSMDWFDWQRRVKQRWDRLKGR